MTGELVTYGPARARFERRKRRRQRQIANAGFWNVLTFVFLLGTILLGAWFVWAVFIQKTSSSAFSNHTQQLVFSQTEKSGTTTVPATVKTDTLKTINLMATGTAIPADETGYAFDLQAEAQSISATLFRSDRKCNWMGVAGQVFDLQGRPVPGITVQVTGPLYGKEIRFLSLTGAAPWYGAGGYEVFLSDAPFESKEIFQVRLVDQTGNGLSPKIAFNTSNECKKNLVILNFRQIK